MDQQNKNIANGRKKKRGFSKGRAVLLAVVAVVAVAAAAAASVLGEIDGRHADESAEITVSVPQGAGTGTVARLLEESGVIRHASLYKLYIRQTGQGGQLQYGDFTLYKGESYADITAALSQYAAADTVRITFPDGNTALDFAARMEQAGLCTAEEFLACANGEDGSDFSQYRFWNEMQDDKNYFMRCEGYLYPETYEFYKDDTVYNYVDTFYSHFNSKVTDDLYTRMDELGMSLHDTIVLASFVQEEAGNEENAHVSAVFHNRLAPDSPYPRLESNASSYVQNPDDNNYIYNWIAPYYDGWDNIPAEIYNAYNTYEISGLPAGAISNPGYDAIYAALYPEEPDANGPYYFFVTDKTGHYYYGRTVEEHNQNCSKAWAVNAKLK